MNCYFLRNDDLERTLKSQICLGLPVAVFPPHDSSPIVFPQVARLCPKVPKLTEVILTIIFHRKFFAQEVITKYFRRMQTVVLSQIVAFLRLNIPT